MTVSGNMYHFTGRGPGPAPYHNSGSASGNYSHHGTTPTYGVSPQATAWTTTHYPLHYPAYSGTTYQQSPQSTSYQNHDFRHSASQTPWATFPQHQQNFVAPYVPGPPAQPHQHSTAYLSGTPLNTHQSYPSQPPQYLPHQPTSAATVSDQESCYNCGNYGHWAQDCPEPRRAVPAGDAKRRNKKQKLTGPPHQPRNQPDLQRGWTHPLPSFQKTQLYAAPPTPQTASPLSQHSWQPAQPQQSTSSQQPTVLTSITGLPSPASPNSSEYPVADVSTAYGFQTSIGLAQSSDHSALSHMSRTPAESNSVEEHSKIDLQSSMQHGDLPTTQTSSADSDVNTSDTEDLLQELIELDAKESQPNNTSDPATEVGQPLPSSMAEADAICPLPRAESLPSGCTTSKYASDDSKKTYVKIIAEDRSDYFVNQDDPIFVEFPEIDQFVPLDELEARSISPNPASSKPDDADWIVDYSPRGSHEHRVAELGHDPNSLETEEQRLSREQEERLVALGVTGTAKPVESLATTVPATRQNDNKGTAHSQRWQPMMRRNTSLSTMDFSTWSHNSTMPPYQIHEPHVSNSFLHPPMRPASSDLSTTGAPSQQYTPSLHNYKKRSLDDNMQQGGQSYKKKKHKQSNGGGSAAHSCRW